MDGIRITMLVLTGALSACSANASGDDTAQADQPGAGLQKRVFEGYRVQLALFTDRKDAEKSRDSFLAHLGGELQGIEVVPLSDSLGLYRVASRPMTAEDAEIACAKLIEQHQSCAVVKR
jgi:SPOR domain